jgi:hypothetical protein
VKWKFHKVKDITINSALRNNIPDFCLPLNILPASQSQEKICNEIKMKKALDWTRPILLRLLLSEAGSEI